MKNFDILLRSGKTVFGYKNLSLLLGTDNENTLKSYFSRATKQNLLQKIGNGIYTLYQYDLLELASTLRPMSYISLDTVLYPPADQWNQNTISLISNNTLLKTLGGKNFSFFKIKDSILLNPIGLEYTGKYLRASRERALCDMVYLFGQQPLDIFDLDLQKLSEISHIYNQTTILFIQNFIDHAQNR